MDEQNNPFGQGHRPPYQNPFVPASIMFGVAGIVTCCCIYISIICGGLSIIFALLSKGGERKISPPAKNGLILGIIAVAATVLITVSSFVITMRQYGGLDNMMNYYEELYSTYLENLK